MGSVQGKEGKTSFVKENTKLYNNNNPVNKNKCRMCCLYIHTVTLS